MAPPYGVSWDAALAGGALAPAAKAAAAKDAAQPADAAAPQRPRLVLPLKRRLLEGANGAEWSRGDAHSSGAEDSEGEPEQQARRVRLSPAAVVVPTPGPAGCAAACSRPASPTRSRLLDLDALPFANRRLSKPSGAARRGVPVVTDSPCAALSARALAERIVDTLLRPAEWTPPANRDFFLSPAEVCTLCDAAMKEFAADPSCVRARAPTKIFGDVHGQFADLLRLFGAYGAPTRGAGGDAALVDYLFLGDYVDRGDHSLEVVCLLFALKVLNPRSINLVRGNHESRDINAYMGLLDECEERLCKGAVGAQATAGGAGKEWWAGMAPGESAAAEAWERINDVFDHMPLAALIEGKILCVHGGIGSTIHTVEDIDAIRRPISVEAGGQILTDLLWSDPTDNDGVKGVVPNPRRGADVVAYGPDVVETFCARNGIEMIVRAHECVMDGIERFAGGRLVTVFSATDYCGVAGNAGAALLVDRELDVQPLIIQPNRAAQPDTPEPIAAPLAADVAHEGAGAEGDASSSDSDLSSDSESDDEAEAKAEASGPVAGATAEPCTSPSTAALLADEDATRWYFDAGTDGKGE